MGRIMYAVPDEGQDINLVHTVRIHTYPCSCKLLMTQAPFSASKLKEYFTLSPQRRFNFRVFDRMAKSQSASFTRSRSQSEAGSEQGDDSQLGW